MLSNAFFVIALGDGARDSEALEEAEVRPASEEETEDTTCLGFFE